MFHTAACMLVTRHLGKNGFTGPILAYVTPLTRLVGLYARGPRCRRVDSRPIGIATLWHRLLADNRFGGNMPSTISALTAISVAMCAFHALPESRRCDAYFAVRARDCS